MKKYFLIFAFLFSVIVGANQVTAATCDYECGYSSAGCYIDVNHESGTETCGNKRNCSSTPTSLCPGGSTVSCTCDMIIQGSSLNSCSGSNAQGNLSCSFGSICQVNTGTIQRVELDCPLNGGGGGGGGGSCNANGFCDAGETYATCPSDNCTPPATNYTLSVSPITRSIVNGEITSYILTIIPANTGAVGTYTLPTPIAGCPTGATCTYSGGNTMTVGQDTTSAGDDFAIPAYKTVIVSASSVAANTYTLTFSAVNSSSQTQSAAASLIVASGVNNASCGAVSVPSSVTAGQTFSATVTMQNNGSTVWTQADGRSDVNGVNNYHLLVSPWPNAAWGGTARAMVGGNVNPGGSTTFTIPLTAPSTPGTYTFSTQMLQEGVQWFGAICGGSSVTVTGGTPPTVTVTAPATATVNVPFTVSWTSTNAASVVPTSTSLTPAGCTMSPTSAPNINDSRTMTCSTTGSKVFQVVVANSSGTQSPPGYGFVTVGAVAAPTVTINPSATSLIVGQAVIFTVSANSGSGLNEIGIESTNAVGTPISNLGLNTVSGNSATGNFSWTPSAVGTYYFDGYAWNSTRTLLTRTTPPVVITVTTPAAVMSGTLTPSTNSCVIASGASTCNINFSWTTTNPVATSAVTKPVNVTVATGNSGTNVPFSIKWGGDTFYLYNSGQLLATSAVGSGGTITCIAGTSWNGTICAPPTPVPVVTISASPTTGVQNVVNPTITWSATGSPSSCTASGDWSGSKAASGSQAQGVLGTVKTYTYTLTCTNGAGTSAPASATVAVSAPSGGGGSCDPSVVGTNRMIGCAYTFPAGSPGFNTITSSAAPVGPTLSSPTAASATPLPQTSLGSGGPGTLTDSYSIRWKGRFSLPAGTYTFNTWSDDGSRAYFDDDNNGTPDAGYVVSAWYDHGGGTVSGSPVAVTAGSHTLVYEMYEATGGAEYGLSWTSVPVAVNNYTLTVNKTVGGSVTSNDGLINCGSTCVRSYPDGASVILTAVRDTVQWVFAGWIGGGCTGTGTCPVIVNGDKTVTAQFKPRSIQYQEF